jgi:dCMP deaminase
VTAVTDGSGKREDYLSWEQYFMAVALLSAQRSKDPNTQVGACIADSRRRIVGVGYAGFPRGCSDDELPWAREGLPLETKYPFVCHAELNAILNRISTDLTGSTIYTTLYPCNECAKAIIQSGIGEVVFLSDKYRDSDANEAARTMFRLAGVTTRKFDEPLSIRLEPER